MQVRESLADGCEHAGTQFGPGAPVKAKDISAAVVLAIGGMLSGCAQDGPATPVMDAVPEARVAPYETLHHDAHHALSATQGADFPHPDRHVRWMPDAPLVEGMARVRTALRALDPPREGATVQASADEIDAAIRYMFENCRLDTEPDVALHAILARLMAGTRALRADPADANPVRDMHAAVENYERLFEDPNDRGGGP
jgi:cytochrome c5